MTLTIFKQFFWLGWISFDGPAAHMGYFRQHFVEKLGWIKDDDFAQIVALSQFLPGPGSSQTGFAIGYQKGGLMGAIAAFVGFTLPSFIIMVILAALSTTLMEAPLYKGVVQGLKLMAVLIVADATWGMYKSFCKGKLTSALCFLSALALILTPSLSVQMLVLVLAALVGVTLLKTKGKANTIPSRVSMAPLVLFALILAIPFLPVSLIGLNIFNDFFQAGSLVFGGGHVVLPLLQSLLGGEVPTDTFLTGYAAAQAVPGPMFTFASFLGYELMPSNPLLGAFIATIGVFIPGFLLMLGFLKSWQSLSQTPVLGGAVAGVNAAVVGLLLSALYNPVFISAVTQISDIILLIVGFIIFKKMKAPIVILVAFFALSGAALNIW
jgi:chromate transporter